MHSLVTRLGIANEYSGTFPVDWNMLAGCLMLPITHTGDSRTRIQVWRVKVQHLSH